MFEGLAGFQIAIPNYETAPIYILILFCFYLEIDMDKY